MSRFLPLTDLLYFRDSQTTETKENRCTCTYTQVYTRRTRLRRLRRREKIEATTQDANAIARANDGKREFGFPNELRLYGPEECVGILIKHQSGTTRMIEIVSSTTGAAEKSLRTSVEDPFPARIRSRSGRTDTRPLPSCATKPIPHDCLSRTTNYIPCALCHPPADSLRVYFVVSFLHGFFIVRLAMSSPCFSSILVILRLVSTCLQSI